MKKIAILLVFCMATSLISFAQSKSGYRIEGGKSKPGRTSNRSSGGGDWMDNVFIQPSFGFSFGTGSLYLNVAPAVGYRILEGWDAGVGLSYTYSKYDVKGFIPYTANTIGGNLFTRYLIKEPFFVMAQYEVMGTQLNVDAPNNGGYSEDRNMYNAFFAGGGIMQPVGRNGAFVLSVLYNFNFDSENPYDNGPYTSPYAISMGFVIGF